VRALQIQAEARDVCVGKEIFYKTLCNKIVDQDWYSRTRLTNQSFSAFAYEFISYDLVLDGWLSMLPVPTDSEKLYLSEDEPMMQLLLSECEEAAIDQNNTDILPMIEKAREFMAAYSNAIHCRFKCCGIEWPSD
jgi:hypothetical protein